MFEYSVVVERNLRRSRHLHGVLMPVVLRENVHVCRFVMNGAGRLPSDLFRVRNEGESDGDGGFGITATTGSSIWNVAPPFVLNSSLFVNFPVEVSLTTIFLTSTTATTFFFNLIVASRRFIRRRPRWPFKQRTKGLSVASWRSHLQNLVAAPGCQALYLPGRRHPSPGDETRRRCSRRAQRDHRARPLLSVQMLWVVAVSRGVFERGAAAAVSSVEVR